MRNIQFDVEFQYLNTNLAFDVGWRKGIEYLEFACCRSLRCILISSWQSGVQIYNPKWWEMCV
jgi:hypothetical protein